MKNITLFLLAILTGTIALGQTVAVSGTVSDQAGKPVPFAFIADAQHPYATFSDSTGNFSLKADPASRLIVTAAGRPSIRVAIDNPSAMKIVMTGDGSGVAANSPGNIFKPDESSTNTYAGSLDLIASQKGDTHGSRFLFNNWVHGFAVTPDNTLKQNDSYLFNYDKIEGNLIFTSDNKGIHQVVKQEVYQFDLYDGNGRQYMFEEVPAIDMKRYMQVLASGSKYKIYKDLGTKFIKANYTTNGITSSGNNYDEYVDESVYYVVKLPGGQPQKLALRKKALKTAFAADADKVNKFLTGNDGDIDDNYLIKLGDYMNQ